MEAIPNKLLDSSEIFYSAKNSRRTVGSKFYPYKDEKLRDKILLNNYYPYLMQSKRHISSNLERGNLIKRYLIMDKERFWY